jgi:hypothetical protein
MDRVADAVQRLFGDAPQSRDPWQQRVNDGPRLSSAPLRAALHPGQEAYPPFFARIKSANRLNR